MTLLLEPANNLSEQNHDALTPINTEEVCTYAGLKLLIYNILLTRERIKSRIKDDFCELPVSKWTGAFTGLIFYSSTKVIVIFIKVHFSL